MTAMLAPAPSATTGSPPPAARRRPLRLRPLPGAPRPLRTVTHTRPEDLLPVDPPLPPVRLVALDSRDEVTSEVDVEPDAPHLRTLTSPTADPGRVCVSILQVAAEAMRGLRPLVQLARWVDAEIFAELAAFAPAHGERTSVRQRLDPDATATVLARARVLRIRVARISPHVAECTALVQVGVRVRAVVVRLEARGPAWRATTLRTV